jgi:hypothetical protein
MQEEFVPRVGISMCKSCCLPGNGECLAGIPRAFTKERAVVARLDVVRLHVVAPCNQGHLGRAEEDA